MPEDKQAYCVEVCKSLGLNPLTQPLKYYTPPNGKEILYATRSAADQLAKIHGVSYSVTSKELDEEMYVVCLKVTDRDGRSIDSIGACPMKKVTKDGNGRYKLDTDGNTMYSPLRGEERANAIMKTHTKAARRGILSITGLGFLDETEVESIQLVESETRVPRSGFKPTLVAPSAKNTNNKIATLTALKTINTNLENLESLKELPVESRPELQPCGLVDQVIPLRDDVLSVEDYKESIVAAKTFIEINRLAQEIRSSGFSRNELDDLLVLWKAKRNELKNS